MGKTGKKRKIYFKSHRAAPFLSLFLSSRRYAPRVYFPVQPAVVNYPFVFLRINVENN